MAVLALTISGSGNVVSDEKEIAGFEEVAVSHAFEVEITRAEGFRVVIRTDDNLREHVHAVKRGRTLEIGLERGKRYNLRNATLTAEVTMPELTGIRLSGASKATVSGFESAKPLEVDASGASKLRGEIKAGDTHLRLSGASEAALAGAGGDLTVEGSGASECDLSAFDVGDAEITLGGASWARVRPSGRLQARLRGASSVRYAGSPSAVETETSGVSSVRREAAALSD